MTALLDAPIPAGLPARQLAAYTPADVITEPGVYDISAETYHADPVLGGSLSSTGARRLLAPGCPAKFQHERQHGRPPKKAFDIGSATHRLVLGKGAEIVDIDADSYNTKAAQNERDAAYTQGLIPLLPKERKQCEAMAAAVFSHHLAGPIFSNPEAQVERSLFWRDEATGVWCRARPDWMTQSSELDRLVMVDLKTTRSAEPDAIAKDVYEYRYHQQDDFYARGAKALKLAPEVAFMFVFVETTPPFLITVVELDMIARQLGAARNRRALQIFKNCSASGVWPEYADRPLRLQLPAWAERADDEEYSA